jgi:large subunit ribosomal protein L32e
MSVEKQRLIRIKKKIKQKKPKFRRFESWRFVRIKNHWRKPRGIDNKMRTEESGWPKKVKVGWGSPTAIRNLHPSGKEEVMVWNQKDIEKVDQENQVARIGGTVGGRKRVLMINKAAELEVKILNPGLSEEHEDESEELEDDVE